MADQTNKQSVVFSPSTYQRHNAAFGAVASQVVTRNPRKGISRFPGVAPGAWGILTSGNSISAVSGTTLGTGSVKLCDSAGVLYDPEIQVDVLNAGTEISADDGNKIIALKWTAGQWSVCGCGGGTSVFCTYICSPYNIPRSTLTATWTAGPGTGGLGGVPGSPSGSGDMVLYPNGFGYGVFTGPTWQYLPPLPTGSGQRGTRVLLTCYVGVTYVLLNPTVSSNFGGSGWHWANTLNDTHTPFPTTGCCPNIASWSPTPVATYGCPYSFGPNLSLVSSSSSPFQLDYDVVNTVSNPHSRLFYTDLTIDGPSGMDFDDLGFKCCDPCPIPRIDLTLTISGSPSTLVYDAPSGTWTDGTYTLTCASAFAHLTGPGTWTLSAADSICDPLHFKFTGTSDAYVDE